MKKASECSLDENNKKETNIVIIKDQKIGFKDVEAGADMQNSLGIPPNNLKRNEYGLYSHVNYIYNYQGFIDWRKMVNPKYLVPNKTNFIKRGEAAPNSSEGLEDKDLLILLAGTKELAQLRGYHSVEYTLVPSSGSILALCRIVWAGNYETNSEDVVFESTADAHELNCNGFGKQFLTTVAENRAFCRAVRNFLQIHILGQDELGPTGGASEEAPATVDKLDYLFGLKEKIRIHKKTFDQIRDKVLDDPEALAIVPEARNWQFIEDVSLSDSFHMCGIIDKWVEKAKQAKQAKAKQ